MTGIRRPDDDSVPGHGGDAVRRVRPDDIRDADAAVELDRWLAELRSDDRGKDRARRRSLVQAAAEEATLHAAITDLAERADIVVFDLADDRAVRGTIRLVGTDVVVVRTGPTETVIRLDAVASIRLLPEGDGRARPSRGAAPLTPRPGPGPGSVDLARVLAALADTTPDVTVHRRGVRHAITGRLVGVGGDVVVVSTPPGATTYVPLVSVVDVSLTGSG